MSKTKSTLFGLAFLAVGGLYGCSLFKHKEPPQPTKPAVSKVIYKDEDDRKFLMYNIKEEISVLGYRNAIEQCTKYYKKYGMDAELEKSAIDLFEAYQNINIDISNRTSLYNKLRSWGLKPMEKLEERKRLEEIARKEQEDKIYNWNKRYFPQPANNQCTTSSKIQQPRRMFFPGAPRIESNQNANQTSLEMYYFNPYEF